MSSNSHPALAGTLLGIGTNAKCQVKPANDQPSRDEMLEKLKADAVALLRRLETASADIKLSSR